MNFRDFYNNPPEPQNRNNYSFRDYRYFNDSPEKPKSPPKEYLTETEQDPFNDVKSMNIHTGQSRYIGGSVYISPHNQSVYAPPQTQSVYIPPQTQSVYMPPPNPQYDRSVYMPQSAYMQTSQPTAPPPVPIPEPPEIPLEIPPETPPPPIDPNVVRAMNPLPSNIKQKPETPKIQHDLNKGFGAFGGTFDDSPNQTEIDEAPIFD